LELLFFAHRLSRRALAAMAGAMAVPAGVSLPAPPVTLPPVAAAAPVDREPVAPLVPGEDCLASTVCSVKAHVRWHTPAWTPETCRDIASAVTSAARKYDLSPTLLLAVMVNESDLDENAFHVTMHGDQIYAKDSGLMGVRCVLDRRGRCTNNRLRGMSWKALMDPLTNIAIGARELASWRTAGVSRVTVKVRDSSGQLVAERKLIRCQHRSHAFWAHYNHGPLYIDHGPARHYPHRVAVLDYALARALDVDAPELAGRITIRDPGERPRTADRPVEERYRKLCRQIGEAGGLCNRVASLPATAAAH
jgi:hypothetical protein